MMFTRESVQGRIDTLIGKAARVRGDLDYQGGLHLDGQIVGNVRADDAPGAVHLEDPIAGCLSAPVQERGDAARTVAALLDLHAVSVEDAVEHPGIGPAGRGEHQGLIEPDAGVPLGEGPQLRGRRVPVRGRLEDHEVVAEAVHLREVDAHW